MRLGKDCLPELPIPGERVFPDNCDDLKEKGKTKKRPFNQQFKVEMDSYCEAGNLFRP